MVKVIEWNETLSLGITSIDKQHRSQLAINAFYDGVSNNSKLFIEKGVK